MADDKKKEYSLLAKCVAEAAGTFAIVAGGCGAVAANRYAGGGVFGASAFGGSVMIGACGAVRKHSLDARRGDAT